MPFAGSLWHKDRWLPCTERIYYRRSYAIKQSWIYLSQRVRERWVRAHHVVGVLQHKPAVDLGPALRAVGINVGLGQLAPHLLVDEELLNDL